MLGSFSFLEATALQYWEQLDCSTSLKLSIMTRYGQLNDVLDQSVKPRDFPDLDLRTGLVPVDFARAAAAVAFVKKNPFWGSVDNAQRRSACVKSWFAGEASCYTTNQRLARYLISPNAPSGASDEPWEFLLRARKLVKAWLGRGPGETQHLNRHGPGTTFSSSVKTPTAADKFAEVPSITRNAVMSLTSLVGTKWGELMASRYRTTFRDCVHVTRGNRFTTVPKTAVTDRGISIEASINVYCQLGIGASMRNRLRRSTGWDLDTAATRHREMARIASVSGSFATLDLSNASDSLATSLVRLLFANTTWLREMDDLRSTHTFLDGKWHFLEKYSGMGNGYTFELETVVFAALCGAAMEICGHTPVLGHNLFVFGDDIIVPTDTVRLVTAALRFCGFRLNPEKSFSDGSFRESCGADFFRGSPVRGYYLKKQVSKNAEAIFNIHNGARVVLQNCGVDSPWFCDWIVTRFLDPGLRSLGGPARLGDQVLHGRPESYRWKHGIRYVRGVRWTVPTVVPWRHFPELSRLACSLVGVRGTPVGIYSRGGHPDLGLVWLSDS